MLFILFCFFFFKQKTAYEMRISDWSSDVCSSDLRAARIACAPSRPGETGPVIKRGPAPKAQPPRKRSGTRTGGIETLERGAAAPADEIGRASCRGRVCQYV